MGCFDLHIIERWVNLSLRLTFVCPSNFALLIDAVLSWVIPKAEAEPRIQEQVIYSGNPPRKKPVRVWGKQAIHNLTKLVS